MNRNPIDTTYIEDEKSYIILMKKQEEQEEPNKIKRKLYVGALKNGKIVDEYYIEKNNKEFKK
jgi:hypothetical protein